MDNPESVEARREIAGITPFKFSEYKDHMDTVCN